MSDRTNEQLEAEIITLRRQIEELQDDLEANQHNDFLKSKTFGMQKLLVFILALFIVTQAILGYFDKQSPITGIGLWYFAFLAAVILVGYLSQIAMMLKQNFSIKTRFSRTGAQLDAAVKHNQTTKKVARKS